MNNKLFDGCRNSGFINAKCVQFHRDLAVVDLVREQRAGLRQVGQEVDNHQSSTVGDGDDATIDTRSDDDGDIDAKLMERRIRRQKARECAQAQKENLKSTNRFLGSSQHQKTDARVSESKKELIDNAPVYCVQAFKKVLIETGFVNDLGKAAKLQVEKKHS